MPRRSLMAWPVLLGFASFCLGSLILVPLGSAQDDKLDRDGLAVTRVQLPAGTKIADLIKAEGALVEVPLGDLQARLDKLRDRQSPLGPRLVRATYRAELVGNNLANGSGQWVIDHPGRTPAILPVPSFNLAVARPRLEGQDAIFGDLDGANLGLWVEKPGLQNLVFDWSARGIGGVQGVSFDLRVPSCPACVLEIKLPADQALSVTKGTGLLSGPHETESPVWKLWRLQTAGRTQIELTVRRGSERGRPPLVFASHDTRVQLTPEISLLEHDFQIEVLHSPVTEFVFEIGPGLQPFDVTARQNPLQGWRVENDVDPKDGKTRSLLRVQLREPHLGVLTGFRVRASMTRWPDQETTLPPLRLVGAIFRGETIKLHLHADQHLERWSPGSFRLTSTTTEPDGGQVLSLVDLSHEGRGTRPRFLVRSQGLDFSTNQQTQWRLGAAEATLTSEVSYDLARGQLFELQVRLPKTGTWQVTSVEVFPRETLQKWVVAGGILHVDLQRGVTPRTDLRLKVQLSAEKDKNPAKARSLDFPDLEPLGAIQRQGSLTIFADPSLQLTLANNSLPTSRPAEDVERDPLLRYVLIFRQTPPSGKVRVVPQRPIVRAQSQQRVQLYPDKARIETRITLEPVLGQPSFADVQIVSPREEPLKFEAKGGEIRSRERFVLAELAGLGLQLGAGSPLGRAAARLMVPTGQVWRVHFRDPLTKSLTFFVRQEIVYPSPFLEGRIVPPLLPIDQGLPLAIEAALSRGHQAWSLPIVIPRDTERLEGELIVQPVGVALNDVQVRGMETLSGINVTSSASFARLFRFKENILQDAPYLSVRTSPRGSEEATQAILEHVEMTDVLDKGGNVTHWVRARVWNWRAKDFRLVLPTGAVVLAARLNQHDLDQLARSPRDDGLEVLIPISQEASPHLVEIAYMTSPIPTWGGLGLEFAAASPRFPLVPLSVNRSVRIASGWLPTRQEEYYSLDRHAPARSSLARGWRLGSELIEELFPPAGPTWLEPQRLTVLGAEAAVRRQLSNETTVAEAFTRLLQDRKDDSAVLILDRWALRGQGISPKTRVAHAADGALPFWDSLDLAYVPTPKAGLLTSRERAQTWGRSAREETIFATLLKEAVFQAMDRGQDASGQFCTLDQWLRTEAVNSSSAVTDVWGGIPGRDHGETLWFPLAGINDGTTVGIVSRSRVRWAGLFAFGLVLGFGLMLRQGVSPRIFFRAIWLILAGLFLGLILVPLSLRELILGPLAGTILLLVLAYRGLLAKGPKAVAREARSTHKAVKVSGGVLVCLALSVFGISSSIGQTAEDRIIYFLGEGANKPVRAFVRPALLRWLEDQERRSLPTDAVFLGARYQGQWDGDVAGFQAEFEVFTFRDNVTLMVPLSGVDLREDNFLDGTPILPVVAAGNKVGYQVMVRNPGHHRLRLSFLSRIHAPGEVKFVGPTTVSSRLTWVMPIKIGPPRLQRGFGEEVTKRDFKKNESLLEAQLGRDATVQILWASPDAGLETAGLQVRELYSWDLRPGVRSLTGLLTMTSSGEVGKLEIHVPANLEVRAIEFLDGGPTRPANLLKGWRVLGKDEQRVLHVDLSRPLSGTFQFLVNLVLRGPQAGPAHDLRLPLPLQAQIQEGLLGLRLAEPDCQEKTQFLSVAAISPEAFVKEWTRLASRDVGPPLHAFRFVRAAKNALSATLEVTPLPARPRLEATQAWTAQSQTIDLAAKLVLSSAEDLAFIPITMPESVVIRDVQGTDVHHWSRSGTSLQVWLIAPRKQTVLEIFGWVPHGFPGKKNVSLPTIQVPGTITDVASLILSSDTSLTLEPKSLAGMTETTVSPLQRKFTLAGGSSSEDFLLKSRFGNAEYQTLTTVEMEGREATVATHWVGRLDYGEFSEVQIRVANWPTPTPKLLVSGPGQKVKQITMGREHVWIVTFPSGTPQRVAFTIKGHMPLVPGQTMDFPEIRIDRGGLMGVRYLGLIGAQVLSPTGVKMTPVRQPAKELGAWPVDANRFRAAGAVLTRLGDEVAPLTLQSRESRPALSARIVESHHRVFLENSSRWAHRMTWSVWSKAGQDIDMLLPGGATFAAAFLNGQVASPRQAGPETLTLSLPASSAPSRVTVCWTYPHVKEPLNQPRLASPKILGLEPPLILGTLHVPSGWQPKETRWALSGGEALLRMAQSQGQAFQILGDESASTTKMGLAAMVQDQQGFFSLACQAQARLNQGGDDDGAVQSQLMKAMDEQRKRAKAFGLESQRQNAEKRPWLAGPIFAEAGADEGVPWVWSNGQGVTDPRVFLSFAPEAGVESTREMTLVALVVVAGVFVVSFWGWGLRIWVKIWPEQLALIVLIGFWFGGFSFLGFGLLVFALLGRILALTRVIRSLARRWWQRPPNGPVSTVYANP